jgi:hypothetical protein
MSKNIAEAVPRLKRLIPRLRGKRIGVLGDLMLDRKRQFPLSISSNRANAWAERGTWPQTSLRLAQKWKRSG